ncbi:MAG: DNA polymerase III subunit gamma/tau [Spirochaetaceae bacterium]|jgi:DNA polymerase-3 subunit gamma/tau|nr:DNA polymerase III subunit gamma/tau [Spirochaetaceae bacterium]
MAYEVTATRKRPQKFQDLAGQDFVVSTISSSIAKGRIAHAYLFSGPRGVGKTSAARILARSLNCQEGPTVDPCGKCNSCIEIARGSAMDVIEIDGASNTGVNDIREIKDEVLFAPNSCRYKVYIIDEVHMLSNSAFNALLKTIEEPPPYIIFIFATTEIHKVPATIRSRCQQFNFRLIDLERVKTLLGQVCQESSIQYDDDALLWIAKEGTGSLRDSYTLFDQVASFSEGYISLEKIREKLGLVGLEQMNQLAKIMLSGDLAQVMDLTDQILNSGVSVDQFLVELAEFFRSLLLIKAGIHRQSILGYEKDKFDLSLTEAYSQEQLLHGQELILNLYRDIRYSLNERFELELLLNRLIQLKEYISPARILGRIERLKQDLKISHISDENNEILIGQEKKKALNP